MLPFNYDQGKDGVVSQGDINWSHATGQTGNGVLIHRGPYSVGCKVLDPNGGEGQIDPLHNQTVYQLTIPSSPAPG